VIEEEETGLDFYRSPGDQAFEEVSKLEQEMNQMYKDIDDMQEQIKENKDLRQMEELMSTTNEAMVTHINVYETLKNQIMLINQDAHDAIQDLD